MGISLGHRRGERSAAVTFFGTPAERARSILLEILRWSEDPLWRSMAPETLAPSLRAAVAHAVENGTPLRFLLPAFPAKSANRDKTTGDTPDLGDVTALFRLEALSRRVRALHPAGAEIVLCSDGRVFADVVGVTDSAVSVYRDGIARAIERHELESLRLYCLEDAYGGAAPDSLRRTLVDEFAVSLEALAEEISRSEMRRSMFNGIHRFLFEDALGTARSRNAARELTKPFAYETVRRSDAWSRLVAEKFPRSVRLSIHPQIEGAEKIPVRLLPSDERWATPWHRSPLWDGRAIKLERRPSIARADARLEHTTEGYAYWRLPDARKVPTDLECLAEEAFR